MIIKEIVENEDGSATLQLDLSPEETSILIEYAIQDILIKEAKRSIEEKASG